MNLDFNFTGAFGHVDPWRRKQIERQDSLGHLQPDRHQHRGLQPARICRFEQQMLDVRERGRGDPERIMCLVVEQFRVRLE